MKKLSLYSTLLLLFAVLILAIALFGSFIIIQSIQTHRKNIDDNIDLSMDMQAERLGGKIEDIHYEITQRIEGNRIAVRKIVEGSSSAYRYYGSVRQILEECVSIRKMDEDMIEEVIYYLPQIGRSISDRVGFAECDKEYLDGFIQNFCAGTSLLTQYEGRLYICSIYPFSSHWNVSVEPEILIAAEISDDALNSCLLTGAYSDCPGALISGSGVLYAFNGFAEDALEQKPGRRQDAIYRTPCANINCTLVKQIPHSYVESSYGYLLNWCLVLAALIVLILILYGVVVHRLVHRPIDDLKQAFGRIHDGDMDARLPEESSSPDFRTLFIRFNFMARKLQETIDSVYKARLFNMEMQLKQLQAQINPHFLYNAFFIMKHQMVAEDYTTAASMADYLGNYFQYITRNARSEVPVSEEYRHACTYLSIQKIRFVDRLELNIDPLPESCAGFMVPRLILQPLMENIFSYGRSSDGLCCRIWLHAEERAGALQLCIEDNGNSLTDAALEQLRQRLDSPDRGIETTGMINIHRRLKLYFPGNDGLTLLKNDFGGLCIRMTIPARPEREGGLLGGSISDSDC